MLRWEGGCACEKVRTEGQPDCGGLVCRALSTFSESSGWAWKDSPSMSPQGLLHPSPVPHLDGSTLGKGLVRFSWASLQPSARLGTEQTRTAFWLKTWILEPDGLGSNPASASY